jgi:hypothetical protein
VLEAADQLALEHRQQRQDREDDAKITSDLTIITQVASTNVRVGERAASGRRLSRSSR